MTATITGIADLLASQRIKGEVAITGRITGVELRKNAARDSWATVTVTDDGLNVIDVKVFPKVYAHVYGLTAQPRVSDTITVTGWVCLPPGDQHVVIYGEQIMQAPQQPTSEPPSEPDTTETQPMTSITGRITATTPDTITIAHDGHATTIDTTAVRDQLILDPRIGDIVEATGQSLDYVEL